MITSRNQTAPSLIAKLTKVQLAFGPENWTTFVKDHPIVKYQEKDWSALRRDFLRAYEEWLQAVALDDALEDSGSVTNQLSKPDSVSEVQETSLVLYSPPAKPLVVHPLVPLLLRGRNSVPCSVNGVPLSLFPAKSRTQQVNPLTFLEPTRSKHPYPSPWNWLGRHLRPGTLRWRSSKQRCVNITARK